jgi:hypothetical protein
MLVGIETGDSSINNFLTEERTTCNLCSSKENSQWRQGKETIFVGIVGYDVWVVKFIKIVKKNTFLN